MHDGAAAPTWTATENSFGYTFLYAPPDGEHDIIGSWTPPRLDQSANSFIKVMISDDPAEAEQWRAELTAGRFPIDLENRR